MTLVLIASAKMVRHPKSSVVTVPKAVRLHLSADGGDTLNFLANDRGEIVVRKAEGATVKQAA